MSFNVVAVSTFEIMRMRLLSSFLYFKLNLRPSFVLALTINRLLFLPCDMMTDVSGMSTISFSKLRLFFGNTFFSFSSSLLPLPPFAVVRALRLLRCLDEESLDERTVLLNLSLVFFKNGTWLYNFSRLNVPLMLY